jgi:uncharacterized protein with HEPN domain
MSGPDDAIRLRHMLDYAREVVGFTRGKSRNALEEDVILERALRYSIGIIGEAASQLSGELRARTPEIPWSDIVGMRNFLFHVYFRIERDILWETATVSIPELIEQLERILSDIDDAPGE